MPRRHPDDGPSASVESAIRTLDRDGAAAVTVEPFSDLSRADARALRTAWPDLARDTRYRSVALMRSLAAEELRLNFERALIVALSDEQSEIRAMALEALWESESSTLLDELLRLLSGEDTPAVRLMLVEALGRFAQLASDGQLAATQTDAIERALLGVLADDSHRDVRAGALAAVAYLRPASMESDVERAFDEGNDSERIAAMQAMGRYGGRRWAPRVIDALRGGDPELRVEAARSAPYVEDNRVVTYLFDAAEDDEDADLQMVAIVALGEVGGEQVVRFLEELRDSTAGEVSEAADEALANARLLEGSDNFGIS